MTNRLTKDDWVDHGLWTLANEGVNALKVGPMSTKLQVSRGSFYWHFRDVADFRSQILQSWQERTTDQVIQLVEAEAKQDRLKHLLKRAIEVEHGPNRATSRNDRSAERAIRSWATDDPDVAAAVEAVDAKRVAYIAQLLVSAGVEAERALPRAAFVNWAYLGQAFVLNLGQASLTTFAIDDICVLLES
jgi:AcrR family transcriptional regulator